MKTLTEAQKRAVDICVNSIAEYGSALNSSKTGTGKTVMATHVAMRLKCPVAVIAPKAVLPHWKKELVDHGILPLFVTNYEKARRGFAPYLTKHGKRNMKWNLPEGTLLIFDEVQRCVRKGTLVSMADGTKKQIEEIKINDWVATPVGARCVLDAVCTGYRCCYRVYHEAGELDCTEDHPIFTANRGWVETAKLQIGDQLVVDHVAKSYKARLYRRLISNLESRVRDTRLGRLIRDSGFIGGIRDYSCVTGIKKVESADCYDLDINNADCFYANGVLVHNCKSPYTLNSLLLITARMQRINTLLLSATAGEDCTEMRATGYALDLHSLNNSTATRLSWQKWMQKYGCWQDQWNEWRSGPKSKLAELHEILYKDRAVRLTEADMPEAFRENLIMEEPMEFSALPVIKRFYREAGLTPAIIDAFIEKQSLKAADPEAAERAEDEEPIIVKMLRARQLAEASKIPEIAEMAVDLEEEGRSVVIFLNFRESALSLRAAIEVELKQPVGIIIGGQSAEERTAELEAFRDDRVHVIVCTTGAGGTGLDGLQDTHGNRPRVSLISPSFSAQEFKQVLGRLPRAYAKSGVLQKILVASGTIEEYVLEAIHRKLANLDALHGK